jgi:hypothetical protein
VNNRWLATSLALMVAVVSATWVVRLFDDPEIKAFIAGIQLTLLAVQIVCLVIGTRQSLREAK